MARALARIAGTLGLVVVFVLAVALGVVLHLDMPRAKRAVIDRVNATLATSFQGRVEIDGVHRMRAGRVTNARGRVFDPRGQEVLRLEGVDIDFDTTGLIRSLFGGPAVDVHIDELVVDDASVRIEVGPSGELTLVEAFAPRVPSTTASRPTHVRIDEIRVRHAWVNGSLPSLPTIDADVSHLAAALVSTESLLKLDLGRAEVAARGLPRKLDAHVWLDGGISMNPERPETLAARVELDGRVRDLPVKAAGDIDGDRVRARVRVPRSPAAVVRQIVPELPLAVPASLEAELSGTLPDLEAKVDLGIGQGRLLAAASGRVGARPSVSFEIEGRNLSPRAFAPDAPNARLSFDARGSVLMRAEGRPYGELQLRTQPTSVDGTAVPALSLDGFGTDQRIEARAVAHEPGAPVSARLSFVPQRGGGRIDFDARMIAPELAKVKRLAGAARGRVIVRASGEVTLPSGVIAARFSGSALGVAMGPVHARSATVSGELDGVPAALDAGLTLRAAHVRAFGRHLNRLSVDTSGPLLRPATRISLSGPNVPTIDGTLDLSLAGAPVAQNVRLDLQRADVRARLVARRISAPRGAVKVEDLALTGPGELAGSFEIGPSELSARARAEALDLAKLAKLLVIPGVQSGTASFDADIRSSARGLHGSLVASLRDVSVDRFEDASASAELELDGRYVTGTLDAALGDAISVHAASSRLRLPPGDFSIAKLRELRGGFSFDAEADLGRVTRMLPRDTLPVSSVRGQLRAHAEFVRSEDDRQIEAKIDLRTRGLHVMGPGVSGKIETRREALKLVPWTLAGVDLQLDATFHDDAHPSHFAARIYDKKGTIVRAEAETSLPLAQLVKSPERAFESMRDKPLSVDVWVPERSLEALPAAVRPRRIAGKVALAAHLRGSLVKPELALELRGEQIRPKNDAKADPFSVTASAEYADDRGRIVAGLKDRRREVLSLRSSFRARLGAVLEGKDPELAGSLALSARNFRLESIPLIADRQFRGRVVGDIELRGLGYQPKLEGELTVHDLEVARTKIESTRLTIDAEDGRLSSTLAVRQSDGYLNARVAAGIDWKKLVPSLSASGPVSAEIRAKAFRAGILLPIVAGSVSKLDGRIDADVKLDVAPGKTALRGGAVLRKGALQIPTIGQEFRQIRGRVDFAPNGVVYVRDVSARGIVGRVRAAAAVRLAGLRFVGARAKVKIADDEKIPLTVEGVSLGNASGAIDLEARATPKRTTLELDVRSFHLELPNLAQRDVQGLDDAERIRIGVERDGRFITLPLQPLEEEASGEPTELLVRVKLGSEVWIRQGTMLRVKLDGAVDVRVIHEPRITGQVQLSRGRIDVQGKMFEVVYGTVTFRGEDPPNPHVAARARWESPDGIVVFADFSGRIDSGTLRLHSQPALTDDQILALLMFGSPDGTLGAGQSGEGGKAATAVGVGGGVATQGLNAALGRLTDLDVTTRIDTSGQNPRPEVAVQVTRRLTAALGYNIGEPAPGKAPDRTLLILDFRLSRRWSLASTFGDRGSSLLDLVWRYRY